jgi:flagellar basal-body rod modification protein FlgD
MVSSVSSSSASPAGTPTTATGNDSKLGKDAFVRLLLTQLQSQDPTEPQKNEAFIAQLAQFTTIELMEKQSGHLESLLVAQAAGNQTAVSGLVGKDVAFSADTITTKTAGEPRDLSVQLPSAANNVLVSVLDEKGNVLRTMQIGPRAAGKSDFSFDGMDSKGNPLPPGKYTLKLVADQNKTAVVGSILQSGSVTGVSFLEGVAQLIVNGERISLPDVLEINERPAA